MLQIRQPVERHRRKRDAISNRPLGLATEPLDACPDRILANVVKDLDVDPLAGHADPARCRQPLLEALDGLAQLTAGQRDAVFGNAGPTLRVARARRLHAAETRSGQGRGHLHRKGEHGDHGHLQSEPPTGRSYGGHLDLRCGRRAPLPLLLRQLASRGCARTSLSLRALDAANLVVIVPRPHEDPSRHNEDRVN